MPVAKTLFLERISALRRSAVIEAVSNKSLAERNHNDVAKMLRNGLAVVGFAALEDFIKKRTSEAVSEIGTSSVQFKDLPEKLQAAATYDAVKALSYQLSIRPDKEECITYVQEHALKLASTASTAYEITPHAFGFDEANVKFETIKRILTSFQIRDPWSEMTLLSSRLGITGLPLVDIYKNAAIRRHKAAHVAHADTPQNDLNQFVTDAFAIAIGFDALLSRALKKIKKNDKKFLNGLQLLTAGDITIRTIKFDGRVWREMLEGKNTAVKIEKIKEDLLLSSQVRSEHAGDLLVQFDTNGIVEYWSSN